MIKTKFQQFLIFLPSNYSKQFWVKMKGKFKSKYSTWNYFLGKLGLSTNAAVISSDDGGKTWWGYCSISFFSLYRASVPFPKALLVHPAQLHTHAEKGHVLQVLSHALHSNANTLSFLGLLDSKEKKKYWWCEKHYKSKNYS